MRLPRLLLALLLLAGLSLAVPAAYAPAALAFQDPWEDPLAPEKGDEDDGVETEEVIEYFPGTQTISARYMADLFGRPHGAFNRFYKDGTSKLRAHYKAGKLNGTFQSFWPDGKPKLVCNYVKGVLNGAYSRKAESGDLQEKATYRKGILWGPRELYRKPHGMSRQAWVNGKLVNIVVITPTTPGDSQKPITAFPRSVEKMRKTLFDILGNEDELSDRSVRTWWRNPGGVGKLRNREKEQRLLHALRRLKAYRYLVGVPYKDLRLDDKMNYYCEWGAQLCEALGRLDHTPKNEPGWPDKEYQDGYNGTSHSNLSMGSPVEFSPDGYMDDSDKKNIDRVGHRCWCINPAMGKTGFGFSKTDKFSAMWSMDKSGKGGGKISTVLFPARGYYPAGFFGNHYAWSVHFKGKNAKGAKIEVIPLDQDYAPAGGPLPFGYERSGKSGYGMSSICNFQPTGVEATPGKAYWVQIVIKSTCIQYLVEFTSVAPPKKDVAGAGKGGIPAKKQ